MAIRWISKTFVFLHRETGFDIPGPFETVQTGRVDAC
jgi:hypothetical protein